MFKAIFPRYSVGDRRLLKSVRQSAQQGFTMFEVLIALMISFLFLTGTLNAMVMATVMRVKAEREPKLVIGLKKIWSKFGHWLQISIRRPAMDVLPVWGLLFGMQTIVLTPIPLMTGLPVCRLQEIEQF
ncbi:prepilin-type N-terminal cleavage/methylation domain-containing protein [Synechocystis sp. B12]|nr:prepilin-type N-terminal cleavage/methylation domain-containing protein [Synechocystis sp. B12]